ncbi:hypothetical protein [Flavobacteriaceae bacterium 14752]|uniref:hypothetical protein n=1 Tax=Mesohalobacter salilacus TaxID=2491711 RepID=UPI000F62D2DA|nr:hypothetical protein EIG84_08050 [Flavobacteriaceae bacterium 14752]
MNTILKFIFFAFTVSLIIACQNKSNSNQLSTAEKAREDSLQIKLKLKEYQTTKLSPQADSLVKSWPMYEELKIEVNRLENYTLQDVISNIPTLYNVVDSLQETIPEAVDTFPVKSRINVLNTKAKHLLLLSEKQRPKLSDIKKMAEEYPFEFNNLNIQLNEVFIELPEFDN